MDVGIRWIVEFRDTRTDVMKRKVKIRDSNVQEKGAFFEVPIKDVPIWLLSHSGPSLSKLPGDLKSSSGTSALDTKPPQGGRSQVSPNIIMLPRHQKRIQASIYESVGKSLAAMHIQGSPEVVAVNVPIFEIRELMTKVIDGQQEGYICPKNSYKAADPRRLLVKHVCKLPKGTTVFVYSISDGKVDVLQL